MKKVKLMMMTLTMCLMTIASFGQTPTIDDVLNKKVRGVLKSIQLNNGAILNIGDTLVIGVSTGNASYNFITQNSPCLSNSYNVPCIDGYYSMGTTAGGSTIIIKSLKARNKRVIVIATRAQGFVYGTRVLSISSAIESGELNINGFLSSDEALSELKKEKDKLDLGLITQEEFNNKKEILSKFIK